MVSIRTQPHIKYYNFNYNNRNVVGLGLYRFDRKFHIRALLALSGQPMGQQGLSRPSLLGLFLRPFR